LQGDHASTPYCRKLAAPAGLVAGNGSRRMNIKAVDLVIENYRQEDGLDNVWAIT